IIVIIMHFTNGVKIISLTNGTVLEFSTKVSSHMRSERRESELKSKSGEGMKKILVEHSMICYSNNTDSHAVTAFLF
ncbi:MAG: hypothetical protein WBP83_08865, partial [Nitrososphaeraceae archaeon]